jgi:biopolymer transport protein ExbD
MTTAKRMTTKKKSHKGFIVIFIVLLIIISFVVFHITRKNSVQIDSKPITLSNSKSVIGLEDLQILSIDVDNSGNLTLVHITLHNNSNKKISNKMAHLYLLDESGNYTFGSSFKISEIDENSQADF